MKFPIILIALALFVSLAKAQPVVEEEQQQKDALDQSISMDRVEEVHQDEILVAEPPELADAIDELIRQEQEVQASPESHSRQKRAVCRCTRSGRRIICICRR